MAELAEVLDHRQEPAAGVILFQPRRHAVAAEYRAFDAVQPLDAENLRAIGEIEADPPRRL
jgi:hypothetical protein